jgi:hypothetical protein
MILQLILIRGQVGRSTGVIKLGNKLNRFNSKQSTSTNNEEEVYMLVQFSLSSAVQVNSFLARLFRPECRRFVLQSFRSSLLGSYRNHGWSKHVRRIGNIKKIVLLKALLVKLSI